MIRVKSHMKTSLQKEKMELKNRHIIIGVTGSVAAYKTLDLIRLLRGEGINTIVVMTESSKRFVTPMSLEIASGNRVFSDTFESTFAHIDLVKESIAMLIAPATANTISKFASGIADNLLTTLFISFDGPRIVAPAMNWRMYENSIFKDKLSYLKEKGVIEIEPESGHLACGDEGIGRMASIETISNVIKKTLTKKNLQGLRTVVTAGPTREYIDPVRFISNRSSGKMGYSIANSAYMRGANVTLISGWTCLNPLSEIEFIQVETAEEMKRATINKTKGTDILIMAAAVSDFKPIKTSSEKIARADSISVSLIKTDDIISRIASRKKRPFIVGFAAETGNKVERAREKLFNKGLDMMVFNDVTLNGAGFDTETNIVTIINRENNFPFQKMKKEEVSNKILDSILEMRT